MVTQTPAEANQRSMKTKLSLSVPFSKTLNIMGMSSFEVQKRKIVFVSFI